MKKTEQEKKNAKYWKDRAMAMEEHKEAQAEELSRRTQQMYRRAYNRLEKDINALYAEILDKGIENIGATQLYNLNSYVELREQLGSLIKELSISLDIQLGDLLLKISVETMKVNGVEFKSGFNMFNEFQAQEIAKQNWSGIKFSDRIWGNANDFNKRVMTDIEKLILEGKTPDQLKKQLIKDFSVSFNEADRLIRTESSRVYNQAALQSYKDVGCTEVDFLAERSCCDLCKPYSKKRFPIEDAPFIPVHPNCRCTYLPVVPGFITEDYEPYTS